MSRSITFLLLLVCALLLNAAFLPLPLRLPCLSARAETCWTNAAEAEAARAAAEAEARALAEEYARLSAEAEEAEEAAEEAEGTEEEEALKKKAESARAAADAVYQQLAEAAMRLKEATEASVRMAKSEAVDSSRISGSFQLGGQYSGRFNENMEPVYVHFEMTVSSRAHMSTSGAKVSITVLDAGGNTLQTLVPSSGGKGYLFHLEEGEYTFLISPIGTEEKYFTVTVTDSLESGAGEEEDFSGDEAEEETEMMTLVEFD